MSLFAEVDAAAEILRRKPGFCEEDLQLGPSASSQNLHVRLCKSLLNKQTIDLLITTQ
jgi:hypothetical protein